MNETKIMLLRLSEAESWVGKIDLNVLMTRAVRVEQRMAKGVNLEDEQRRYHILCERIEFYTQQILARNVGKTEVLGGEYLSLLRLLSKRYPEEVARARLMANFCPKQFLGQHINQFENLTRRLGWFECSDVQTKIRFYKEAIESNKNVFELQIPWSEVGIHNEISDEGMVDLQKSFLDLKVVDEITENVDRSPFLNLKAQIDLVIQRVNQGLPAAVSFSDLRHDVIPEVLHDFVYGSGKPMYLPVTYADGSEAARFPIHCLRLRSGETMRKMREEPMIKVGQLSARHPEMDPQVRVYFFRNQEISIGKMSAEIDTVAYQKAKEIFLRMRAEGSFRLGYYQTGFQPAVVGFYRALTEELLDTAKKQPAIEVTPYYYLGGSYKAGKIWC